MRQRRKPYLESSAGGLRLSALGDARILEKIGEGGRSTAYAVEWNGGRYALKLYKTDAVERHRRKHDQELAAYEFERNQAFYDAPGLRRYVARPVAYLASPGVSAFIQEELGGPLYYFYYEERGGDVPASFAQHLAKILECAHAAGLYDVDLHSMNVIVVEEDGELIPKLFDFNLIPFHVHPPNPLVAFLLKVGLIDVRSRDLRKLAAFHDFSREEKKLLKFYR